MSGFGLTQTLSLSGDNEKAEELDSKIAELKSQKAQLGLFLQMCRLYTCLLLQLTSRTLIHRVPDFPAGNTDVTITANI